MVLGDTLFFSNHSEEHVSNINFVSNHFFSNHKYRLMYWLFVLPCCCVYESTCLMPAVVSHKSCFQKSCNQCQFWRFCHLQCDLQLFICPCLSYLNNCFCHLKSRNLSNLGKIILIPCHVLITFFGMSSGCRMLCIVRGGCIWCLSTWI